MPGRLALASSHTAKPLTSVAVVLVFDDPRLRHYCLPCNLSGRSNSRRLDKRQLIPCALPLRRRASRDVSLAHPTTLSPAMSPPGRWLGDLGQSAEGASTLGGQLAR